MGVQLEFNYRLHLRGHNAPNNGLEDRLPEKIVVSEGDETTVYSFEKEGQRIYPLGREIPLYRINSQESKTEIGRAQVMETTHRKEGDCIVTTGKYTITALNGHQ